MGRTLPHDTPREIFNIMMEALKQRTPSWISSRNPQRYTAVAMIIEEYYVCDYCCDMLSGTSYLRAIPRDCSWMIFKHLQGTLKYVDALMRTFAGRRPRRGKSDCYGVVGRPDSNLYVMGCSLEYMYVSYKRDTLFVASDDYASFRLCGYEHNSGLVLGGLAAAKFGVLLNGAVRMAGVELLQPQTIDFNGRRYLLEYCYRGYLFGTTYISPGMIHTAYNGFRHYAPYSFDVATPEYKRDIISRPLPR